MIHIMLHMYLPMRYGTPNLSYSDKFDSVLRFFVPEEKERKIKIGRASCRERVC